MPTLPFAFVRWDDTLLRVIDGVIALRFDGEEHLLSPGGEAIVPAGFHHTHVRRHRRGANRDGLPPRLQGRGLTSASTSWSQPRTSWSSEYPSSLRIRRCWAGSSIAISDSAV